MPSIESEPKTTIPLSEKSFTNTLRFLADVSVVPIDWKMQFPEKAKTQAQAHWEKMWEIVGLYTGTDESLEQIADKYKLAHRKSTSKSITRPCQTAINSFKTKPLKVYGWHKLEDCATYGRRP